MMEKRINSAAGSDRGAAEPNLVVSVQDSAVEHTSDDNDTTNKPESGREYVTGVKLWLVLASVTLVAFLMLLDMSIIVTAIPKITNEFHSLGDVGWYGSAFLLANCALQPLTGRLYTLLSYKYTFVAFVIVFEIGSVVCGSAQTSNSLIVGRAIAGLGGSGLMNGAMTIISACAPKDKQPLMVGTMMGISQIGIISGPLIGGALTESVSWRWCFYINLPIGAAAVILLLLIHIPDNRSHEISSSKTSVLPTLKKLDVLGFVLFAAFAIMIELALAWGGADYPWNSSPVIGLLCGGGVALVLFTLWEVRVGDRAMIPPSVVRRREVWTSSIFLGLFSGAMLVFSYYMPIYFQAVKGVSAMLSGVYMLAGIGPQILMAITSGALIAKTGNYLPWALISAVLTALGAGLMTTLSVHATVAQWVMYQFVAGLGRGCGMQIPIIAVQKSLPAAQIPIGMSTVIFMQTFGGSLALTVADLIFDHALLSGLAKYAPTVDAAQVVSAGATAFRDVVDSAQLPGILKAYAKSINHAFYLSAGASSATFICAWGMRKNFATMKKSTLE